MKILGIDSSGLVASVAVMEDEILRAEYIIQYKKTHSQTLLPMLDEVRQLIQLDMESVDVLAVAAGPGSFTGLRIGSATVKGLGLALNKPVAEIPTLEALAYNLYGMGGLICPIMDARRNQVYTGVYCYRPEGESFRLECVREQDALGVDELIDELNRRGEAVTFLGDGVAVYRDRIREQCKVSVSFAPNHRMYQSAASVAALGMVYAKKGCLVKAALHQPEYLRKSQAEREREEHEHSQNA